MPRTTTSRAGTTERQDGGQAAPDARTAFDPGPARIPLVDLSPAVPGLWPDASASRAFAGEVVPFEATAFREGHDLIGVELHLTAPDGTTAVHRMRAVAPGTDRWRAEAALDRVGDWTWSVRAFSDDLATWARAARAKIAAGVEPELMLDTGAALLTEAAGERVGRAAAAYRAWAATLADRAAGVEARAAVLDDPELDVIIERHPRSTLESWSDPQRLRVERTAAGSGAWYEFFPRSIGASVDAAGRWRSGTLRHATDHLAWVAAQGYDVVYLPPIHPIGLSHRKGRNNAESAEPGEPGSPWAIGSADGGHDAIHPDLGDEADFARFVDTADGLGLEVALDLALQASPDHPWVREHPEWFTERVDGSIATAENPPKRYQDIYPIDFDRDPAGIGEEVRRIVLLWVSRGVRIFRVDNPHTKPTAFWAWLLAEIRAEHPDVVFLAEAFTRPAPLRALARAGFQQSYGYFTWRNTREELEEFLVDSAGDAAAYLRQNLFVNTPDILTEYLQYGGEPAYRIRAAIAATASPLWGVYSGFELLENVARPGAEENIDNEKYEYKPRDMAAAEAVGRSIAPFIRSLNRIRRDHPALGQLRGLAIHETNHPAVLAYSKRLSGAFTADGADDTILVVAGLDPHGSAETVLDLDLDALGLAPGAAFVATDLLTGEAWPWDARPYVRLDAFERPVHILRIAESGGAA